MTDSGSPPYQVSFSDLQLQQLRDFANCADAAGRRIEFASAISHIYKALQDDPIGFGDPNFNLKQMGLAICQRIYSMLRVGYGVDEKLRIVYIRTVDLYPPDLGIASKQS